MFNEIIIGIFFFIFIASTVAFILLKAKSSLKKHRLLALIANNHLLFCLLFVFVHSIGFIGLINGVIILAVSWSIGFLFEYLGVRYGWIYGSYYYTNTSPIFFNKLPRATPFSWAFIIYLCFTSAVYILQPFSQAGIFGIFGFAVYGGLLCVTLDLLIDPVATDPRVNGWVWLKKGRYFGIPASNYVGWFVTGITSILLFTGIILSYLTKLPVNAGLGVLSVLAYFAFFGLYLYEAFALKKYKVILISSLVSALLFILPQLALMLTSH